MPNELKLAFLYINLYFGESGRNAYSRGKEHFEKKIAKDGDNSVLWLHSIHHHQVLEDVNYNMKVTRRNINISNSEMQPSISVKKEIIFNMHVLSTFSGQTFESVLICLKVKAGGN